MSYRNPFSFGRVMGC